MSDAPEPVVLYSSWRGLVAGLLTPGLLMGLPVFGTFLADRVTIVASLIFLAGAVLAGITLFDLPRRSVFEADGIRRHCPLRTQHIPWERVSAIERAPGPVMSGPQDPEARRLSRRPGGLTAMVGRRKVLLVDVVEGEMEYDELRKAIEAWSPGVMLRARRPPDGSTPTWTYHERDRTR